MTHVVINDRRCFNWLIFVCVAAELPGVFNVSVSPQQTGQTVVSVQIPPTFGGYYEVVISTPPSNGSLLIQVTIKSWGMHAIDSASFADHTSRVFRGLINLKCQTLKMLLFMLPLELYSACERHANCHTTRCADAWNKILDHCPDKAGKLFWKYNKCWVLHMYVYLLDYMVIP